MQTDGMARALIALDITGNPDGLVEVLRLVEGQDTAQFFA